MKKKSIMARVGVLALALTLVTSSLTSGTLARYTDSSGIFAKAIVAKWAFSATSGGQVMDRDTPVNLYNTMTNANSQIASGKIAPGMTGSIPIKIDMTGSEVNAELKVEIALADANGLPKEEVAEGWSAQTLPEGLKFFLASDETQTALTIGETFKPLGQAKITNIATKDMTWMDTITWAWEYTAREADAPVQTARNLNDTTIGKLAPTLNIVIRVSATQVDSTGKVPV